MRSVPKPSATSHPTVHPGSPHRAHLHLGEPHPARQLAALGGAQVAVPLKGALQGADLLGAERRAQPPAASRLLGARALAAPLLLRLPRCTWRRKKKASGRPEGYPSASIPSLAPGRGTQFMQPSHPRVSRWPRLPAAGGVAEGSLPFPAPFSLLRSLSPGLELEARRRPAAEGDDRCGVPWVGLLGAWLLWDSHSTEKGALVILLRFGAAEKDSVRKHDSFIPQVPEENVVCINTHQRAR